MQTSKLRQITRRWNAFCIHSSFICFDYMYYSLLSHPHVTQIDHLKHTWLSLNTWQKTLQTLETTGHVL